MAAAVPAGIAVAGAGAQYLNERGADKRRQRIISAALGDARKRKDSIANTTMNEAEKYSEAQRAPQRAEAEGVANADYQKALTASDAISTPEVRSGKLSEDYKTALPAGMADATAKSQRRAALLAKVRAPGDLRQNEAVRRGGVTEEVGSRLTDTNFMVDAAGRDAASVRANPWINLAGQAAQIYGGVAGYNAAVNAERMKTIKMMMGGGGSSLGVGPFTGGL